jgi:hypothetical protein
MNIKAIIPMKKVLGLITRIVIGVFFAIVQAGAFLEGELLSASSGLILALFATVNPSSFTSRTKINYWLVFIALFITALGLSYVDMKNG